MKIVLASQSPQRLAVMQTLGLPFEVIPADIDEKKITGETQIARAEQVAIAKAKAVATKVPDAIIIAADTYVIHQGRALEKPESLAEAAEMLQTQSGQWLLEVSGWCLWVPGQAPISGVAQTKFKFRDVSPAEIDRYVATQPVLTWSAAFSPAYSEGAALIAEVQGSLTGFTHGLPLDEIVPRLVAILPGII